jgi:hypothetical protein
LSGDGARKRHFQPVENPGDAKRYDDKSVEPSPAEPVEPRRDGGFDQRRVWLGPHSSVLVGRQQLVERHRLASLMLSLLNLDLAPIPVKATRRQV